MTRWLLLLVIVAASGCVHPQVTTPEICTEEWRQFVEQRLQTGDSQGHGPDIGSPEWQSVVEFKLGLRGSSEVPARTSDAWCAYIDNKIRAYDR